VIQLVENVQREDLSQIDLYNALRALRKQGMTLREIAELMGKSEVYVKNLFVGVNDIQRNDKLKELLGSAGTTIQDVKETKGIPDEQERLKLLKQHNTGETTRAEMRKKAKDLKTASSKVSTAPVSTESVSIVPGRIPALRVESAINLEIKVNSEDKSIVVSVTDFREPDLPALKNIIRDAIKKSEKYYIHDVTEDFQRKFEDGREDDS
jgi:ParB family chromosome partitioning protein